MRVAAQLRSGCSAPSALRFFVLVWCRIFFLVEVVEVVVKHMCYKVYNRGSIEDSASINERPRGETSEFAYTTASESAVISTTSSCKFVERARRSPPESPSRPTPRPGGRQLVPTAELKDTGTDQRAPTTSAEPEFSFANSLIRARRGGEGCVKLQAVGASVRGRVPRGRHRKRRSSSERTGSAFAAARRDTPPSLSTNSTKCCRKMTTRRLCRGRAEPLRRRFD